MKLLIEKLVDEVKLKVAEKNQFEHQLLPKITSAFLPLLQYQDTSGKNKIVECYWRSVFEQNIIGRTLGSKSHVVSFEWQNVRKVTAVVHHSVFDVFGPSSYEQQKHIEKFFKACP